MKIECPKEFRKIFPDYKWEIVVHESLEDWNYDRLGTAGEIPEGNNVEIIEKTVRDKLLFYKISGKTSKGKLIVGWTTCHFLNLENKVSD